MFVYVNKQTRSLDGHICCARMWNKGKMFPQAKKNRLTGGEPTACAVI